MKKNELTAAEKVLLAMTFSEARETRSKRAAISRAGLTGMTPKSIWEAQRLAWRRFRQADLTTGKVPSWVSAARFLSHKTWQHMRCPVKPGKVIDSKELMFAAYSLVQWGNARKRSYGYANLWTAGILETDNGKGGWNRVVWRHAQYICVVSPDRRKVFFQLPGEKGKVATVFRGNFLHNGKRSSLGSWYELSRPATHIYSIRQTCEHLCRAGLDARLVRQTAEMIVTGSGDSLRSGGKINCVVDCGDSTFYHAYVGEAPAHVMRNIGLRKNAKVSQEERRIARKAEQEILKSIWVCEEDSLKAGNCEAGTRLFMTLIRKAVGATGELGAVRGDWLISQRDDSYTRAACLRAKERMGV